MDINWKISFVHGILIFLGTSLVDDAIAMAKSEHDKLKKELIKQGDSRVRDDF